MERREDSVLHSLKELRTIEEDRIRSEQEAERQRLENIRLAEEDARRKVKEAEENKLREEKEHKEALVREHEQQEREDKLRLEETDRRARIDARAKVEAARVSAEISAKAQNKKPHLGLVLGSVGGVVLLAAASLFYVLGVYIPQRDAELAKKHQIAQEKAIAAAVQNARAQVADEYKVKIANAKNEAERDALRRELETKQREREESVRARSHPTRVTTGPTAPVKKQGMTLKCDPEKDPLCGADIK